MEKPQKIEHNEILFLLSKFINSIDGFHNTALAFKEDLNKSSFLGETIGWNGEVRLTQLQDWDKRHTSIPPDHIVSHLRNSLAGIKETGNIGLLPSLLQQLVGVFNFSSPAQHTKYRELSMKLCDTVSNIKKITNKSIRLQNRKRNITCELAYNQSPPSKQLNREDDSTNMIIDVSGGDDVVPILRKVGKTNEITRIDADLDAISAEQTVLSAELKDVVLLLGNMGCLSASQTRGTMDSTLCWLSSRSLGLTGHAFHSGLGNSMIPRAMTIRRQLASTLKVQWTVHAHMMNPTYCAVFDQTGQYILTGADDYLVKIWHAEKGLLVRTCRGHMSYISIIAVSPDNALFASGCVNGMIRVWRLFDGMCLAVMHHKFGINWLRFDPATGSLASTSDDGACIVWDLTVLLPLESISAPHIEIILEEEQFNSVLVRNMPIRSHSEHDIELVSETKTPHQNGIFQWSKKIMTSSSNHSSNGHSVNNNLANRIVSQLDSRSTRLPLVDLMADDDNGAVMQQHQASSSSEPFLVLPHIQDIFEERGGGGDDQCDSLKVLCLDICPAGNFLVTGCADGVARIWRFGDPDGVLSSRSAGIATRGTVGSNKLRPMDLALSNLGGLIDREEFARMERIAKHMLQRLEGHVSPITDIHFSSQGDRIVSGSAQDGNVRIWSMSRDFTTNTHIVLNLADDEDNVSQPAFQTRVRGKAGRTTRTQVYNVVWTADDLRVVTIQSVPPPSSAVHAGEKPSTRLKLWDSMTGDLLRVIWCVSNSKCNVLMTHPLDSQIALTSGEDGIVNVWNMDTETNLSRNFLRNDDGTPSHIVDACYSPDGTRVAVSNMVGRVTLLSLDDPARYNGREMYTEQYFSTDYNNIILDAAGFAIDEGTQLPVHESPCGQLTRLDNSAYELQPVIPCGPRPLSVEEMRTKLKGVIECREQIGRIMDRVNASFHRNYNHGRTPKKYKADKNRSRATTNGVKSSTQQQRTMQYKEFDLSQYQPSSDDSELDSDWERVRRDTTSSGVRRSGRATSSSLASSSRHERGFRNGVIHDLRSTRSGAQSRGGGRRTESGSGNIHTLDSLVRRSSRTAISRGGSYRSQDEDDFTGSFSADGSSVLRAQRAAQRAANRSRVLRLQTIDDDETADETGEGSESDNGSSSSDGEEVEISASRRRSMRNNSSNRRRGNERQRSHRGMISVDSDADEEVLMERPSTATSSRSHNSRPKRLWAGRTLPNGLHVLPQDSKVDRAWLQSDRYTEEQYCPQVGDKVVYLCQGHQDLLSFFPESSSPPWMSFGQKWPLVECEVRAVEYRLPSEQDLRRCPSVVVRVTLVVLRLPHSLNITPQGLYNIQLTTPRSTRNNAAKELSFVVSLRSCHVPEFLILSHHFFRSVRLPFFDGLRIHVQYKEVCPSTGEVSFKPFCGRVVRLSNKTPEWPFSPWEALEVVWDTTDDDEGESNRNSEFDRIGPWEATPEYDPDSESAVIRAKFVVPQLDATVAEHIATEIEQLVGLNENYLPFMYEVDSQEYFDYYCIIAVPMYIDLILRRLRSGYYRQLEAVEFDINTIYDNCSFYNDRQSLIVKTAAELRTQLQKIVRPDHNQNMAVVSSGDDITFVATSSSSGLINTTESQNSSELTLHFNKRTRSSAVNNTTHSRNNTQHGEDDDECDEDEAKFSDTPQILRFKRQRVETDSSQNNRASRSSSTGSNSNHMEVDVHDSNVVRSTRSSGSNSNGVDTRSGSHSAVVVMHPTRAAGARITRAASSNVPIDSLSTLTAANHNNTNRNTDNGGRVTRGRVSSVGATVSSQSASASHRNSRQGTSRDSSQRRSSRPRTAINYHQQSSDDDENNSDDSEEDTKPLKITFNNRGGKVQKTESRSLRSGKERIKNKTDECNDNDDNSDASDDSGSSNSEDDSSSAERNDDLDVDESFEVVMPPPTQPLTTSRSGRTVKPVVNYWEGSAGAADVGRRKRSHSYEDEEEEEEVHHTSSSSKRSSSVAQLQTRQSLPRLDPETKRLMLQVVGHAEHLDEEFGLFGQPVDLESTPLYGDIVERPMDLGTVRANILARYYHSVQEVIDDILLIYSNCILYNDDKSLFAIQATKQRRNFNSFIRLQLHSS